MDQARNQVLQAIRAGQRRPRRPGAVLYTTSRIKSPESACRKLRQRGLPATAQAALTRIRDAVGVRVICAFQDDVYQMAQYLEERPEFAVLQTKDYISHPKENGYRSYHLILGILDGPGKGMTVEVQLRTIAIDCWASLEHQIITSGGCPMNTWSGRNSSAAPTRSPRWTCPWRPSGSCSTGPEPAAERTPGEETLPRRGFWVWDRLGQSSRRPGGPPHRESWPGRAFLARKLFWAPWVTESPGRRWPSSRGEAGSWYR